MHILDQILEVKKEEVKQLRSQKRYRHFTDSPFYERRQYSLAAALKENPDIAVIAEVKKASPSAGILREEFDPLDIARIYNEGFADAISVLTDRNYFQGSLQFLYKIAGSRTLPLLRKDFIIDDYQVFESRANGADAVLLICEILSASQIGELTNAATEAGLEVLLEMHDHDQLQKIDFRQNRLLGINNRNLENFQVDLNTTITITEVLPKKCVVVSESGVSRREDIERLKATNTAAVLVGEYLMRAPEIGQALEELKGWCRLES